MVLGDGRRSEERGRYASYYVSHPWKLPEQRLKSPYLTCV